VFEFSRRTVVGSAICFFFAACGSVSQGSGESDASQLLIDWQSHTRTPTPVLHDRPPNEPAVSPLVQVLPWDFKKTFPQPTDETVDSGVLDESVATIVGQLLKGGPQALAAAKKLIADVSRRPMDDALSAETAGRIAAIRVEREGQEGLAAFFGKRKPDWS